MIQAPTLAPFFGCGTPTALITPGGADTYLSSKQDQCGLPPPPPPPLPSILSPASASLQQQQRLLLSQHILPTTPTTSTLNFNVSQQLSNAGALPRPASNQNQPVFSTLLPPVSVGVDGTPSPAGQPSPVAALAAAISSPVLNVPTSLLAVRDSQWLKMRVCQAYLKSVVLQKATKEENKCPFTAESCPLAHPKPNVKVEQDHVTVCYDFIKRNDCRHSNCKYYHPPAHQIEVVLKRGDVNKKGSNQPLRLAPQTPLMGQTPGLCWPSALPSTIVNPTGMLSAVNTPVMPSSSVNMAMLAAALRGYPTHPSVAYLAAAYPKATSTQPTIASQQIDPSFGTNYGFYAPVSSVAAGATMLPSDLQSSLLTNPQASSASAVYAAMSAANATAASRSQLPADNLISNGIASESAPVLRRKREADNGAGSVPEAYAGWQPPKRSNVMPSGRKSQSTNGQDSADSVIKSENLECPTNVSAVSVSASYPINSTCGPAVSQASSDYSNQQLASALALNSLLQQNSPFVSYSPVAPPTATSPISQQQTQQQMYIALMRLQAAQQLQQQQQQQLAAAAMVNSYTLSGLVPGLASAYPAGLIDSLAFQNQLAAGLTPNSYTSTLLQNQPVLTNVAYINDEGQLLESLPICRDFKAGKCHRNTDCRYVHLIDENVEVNQGRVTVCRDAAKGRCTRIPCKYYHIPLFAISASRSLALNSALANAAKVSTGSTASTVTGSI